MNREDFSCAIKREFAQVFPGGVCDVLDCDFQTGHFSLKIDVYADQRQKEEFSTYPISLSFGVEGDGYAKCVTVPDELNVSIDMSHDPFFCVAHKNPLKHNLYYVSNCFKFPVTYAYMGVKVDQNEFIKRLSSGLKNLYSCMLQAEEKDMFCPDCVERINKMLHGSKWEGVST